MRPINSKNRPKNRPKPKMVSWADHHVAHALGEDSYILWDDNWMFSAASFWEIAYELFTYPEVFHENT